MGQARSLPHHSVHTRFINHTEMMGGAKKDKTERGGKEELIVASYKNKDIVLCTLLLPRQYIVTVHHCLFFKIYTPSFRLNDLLAVNQKPKHTSLASVDLVNWKPEVSYV